MTVGELMDLLGDCDPDAEVRLAMQPQWPLEYGLRCVAAGFDGEDGEPGRVYLAEGGQIGYLPSEVSEEVWA